MSEILQIINEGSAAYLTFKLRDKDGELATPTRVSYSIYDMTNGVVIVPETDLPSPVATGIIALDSDCTAIYNQANARETKVVTIRGYYGSKDQVNAEYRFQVRNLVMVI